MMVLESLPLTRNLYRILNDKRPSWPDIDERLPRWALGNWWSRFYEYSEESYLELLKTFEQNRLPLSVAVLDMDWYLVDDPVVMAAGSSGWTGYSWNRELFPDPPRFIRRLHDRNLKVTLNEHPVAGIHSHENEYAAMAKALRHDTSRLAPIVFNCTDKLFMKAYFDILLKPLEVDGVNFWWIDWQSGNRSQMPGVDPLWVLNHLHYRHSAAIQATSRTLANGVSRPLILSRYAGPGSHRYPLGFSGDTVASWKSLAFQPEFTATASNIGYGWWSHDIGGFMSQCRDDELIARWVQLGVFSPILRLHSNKKLGVSKEPWKLADGSQRSPQGVVSAFLRLRHRLVPYMHTMNARAAIHGEPLIQPMYWDYPEHERAYSVPNQYFFGTDMMIVPITSPVQKETAAGKVHAWLPPGQWVDFFTGVMYTGDRDVWLHRSLDKYPVLLRPGSIVPLDISKEPGNGADNPAGFETIVVVGVDGRFEILEEQQTNLVGKTAAEVDWTRTAVTLDQAQGIITIGPTTGGSPSIRRTWAVRLLGIKPASDMHVTINGLAVSPQVSLEENGTLVQLGAVEACGVAQILLGPRVEATLIGLWDIFRAVVHENDFSEDVRKEIRGILSQEDATVADKISRIKTSGMNSAVQLLLAECSVAGDRFSIQEDGRLS